jgi:hypothetical protein
VWLDYKNTLISHRNKILFSYQNDIQLPDTIRISMDLVLNMVLVLLLFYLNDVSSFVDLMMNHSNHHYSNDSDDVVDEYNHVVFEHEYFVKLVEQFQLQYWFDRLEKNKNFMET